MRAIVALAALSLTTLPAQTVLQSTDEQTQETFLTIYNSNLALVRQTREVPLTEGEIALEFIDVAAQIDPTTVHITSLSNPDQFRVLEQNFEYDLLSPNRLLENFVGREITIRSNLTAGDEPFLERTGTLMSVQGGRIVRTEDGVIINPQGELAVTGDLGNLRAEPTLVWLLQNGVETTQTLEASYLTSGINWEADYVAVINETDTAMDLTGWVTINNQSGATYDAARLKLVAGDVNRNPQPMPMAMGGMMESRSMMAYDMAAPQFEEQSFFEYHLYSLQRPTTILDRQTKQMTLLTANDATTDKRYIYESPMIHPHLRWNTQEDPDHLQVVMEFENTEENNMGIPLPRGDVRLYRADDDGALQFIGEDRIDHTPRNETIRLKVGEAFDIVGERKQTDFRNLIGNHVEHDWEVTVRNQKDEAITVTVVERPIGDWRITRSTHEWEQTASDSVEFTIEIPAEGEVTIGYTVNYDLD